MSEILQPDSQFYRSCILYEALQRKPVEEAFKTIKTVFPNAEFFDFQYWFYRFYNGNHELNHDRSTDPKTRFFSDMPVDVVEKIVGKVKLANRLILRKVSRNFRSVVDQMKTNCGSVSLSLFWNSSHFQMGTYLIDYYSVEGEKNKCDITFISCSDSDYYMKTVINRKQVEGDHFELVMKDLSSVLMNPNWKFASFSVDVNRIERYDEKEVDDEKKIKNIQSILCSSFSKTQVQKFTIKSSTLAPMVTLLPYLNLDSLESIRFNCNEIDKESMNTIMEMDQWKQANELHFERIPDWFPIENLFHAVRFHVDNINITCGRIDDISNMLLENPIFEHCYLNHYTTLNEFMSDDSDSDEDLNNLQQHVDEFMGVHYDPRSKRFQIPDSMDYFEIEVKRRYLDLGLYIQKKSNHN